MNSKMSTIRKLGAGNSYNVTIPHNICQRLRIQKDTIVKMEEIEGKVIMTPILGLAETKEIAVEQALPAQENK